MQDPTTWAEANQRYLIAALAEIRAALERHAAPGEGALPPPASLDAFSETAPPALETLCATFRTGRSCGLSSFERAIVLLCAGMELDAAFSGL
jgi:hypothetical protein